MTKIIKEVTISEIMKVVDSKLDVIDLPSFTTTLYQSIIINVSVGKGYDRHLVPLERKDGSIE